MSSQSGIAIPAAVTDAWSSVVNGKQGESRAVVLTIEGEQYKHLSTISPKGDFKEDIALLLPALPNEKTCASFAYRTDDRTGGSGSDQYGWLMITFVPDEAPVRQKMLHASSKASLLKASGESRFKRTMFFTSPHDLSPSSFSSHLAHLDAPPPLSKSEQALAQIKADEANEASNRLAALFGHPASSPSREGGSGGSFSGAKSPLKSPEIGIRNAIGIGAAGMGGGGGGVRAGLKWTDEVESKLKELAEGDTVGRAVILHIEPKTETLKVQESVQVSPADLAKKVPTKEPAFTFYAWPIDKEAAAASVSKGSKSEQPSRSNSLQVPGATNSTDPADVPLPVSPAVETPPATEGAKESDAASEPQVEEPVAAKTRPTVFMIYSCPSASPVRYRMIYSSSVRSTIFEASQRIGFPIEKKIEVSEVQDLTETYIKSEIFPQKSQSSSWSTEPVKTPSRQQSAQSALSPGYRPLPMPGRQSTTSSTMSNASEAASVKSNDSNGSLPDSAFSMFGPRVNVGSPGGGGFARPRPAGKR